MDNKTINVTHHGDQLPADHIIRKHPDFRELVELVDHTLFHVLAVTIAHEINVAAELVKSVARGDVIKERTPRGFRYQY